jgi:O-antigen ligase
LLFIVALAIPLAYSNDTYKSLKQSLVTISVAATAYSLFNFITLPTSLSESARFAGYFKGAASFALVLGGLLPFTLWGLWRASNIPIRIVCGSGFVFGIVTLILTGQRAGTIAGLVGMVPLLLTLVQRKNIKWFVLLIVPPFLLGYTLLEHSSLERVKFLSQRYSAESDLSGRPIIWKIALSEIDKSPLLGRGVGGAETVIINSFHNAYLEVWYNTGLLGLFLFLAAQFYFLFRIAYLGRIYRDAEMRALLALALGYMMGFIVMCIFESVGAGASNINLILYLFLMVLVSNNHLPEYTGQSNRGRAALC